MSTLTLQLSENRKHIHSLRLSAETTIETTLTIGHEGVGIPKLISIVNIVGHINDAGWELDNSQASHNIAAFITTYYTPTPSHLWTDQTLQISVTPILPINTPYYRAMQGIQHEVVSTARAMEQNKLRGNVTASTLVQNALVDHIKTEVQSKPDWWSKIPEILLHTALTALFDSLLGFPLKTLLSSIIGGFFNIRYYPGN